jgi:formimidoylglutamate deiminase
LFGGENNRIEGFVHVALLKSISFLPGASPYLLQLGRIHWQELHEIASFRFTLPFDMNESTLHSYDPGRPSAITATLFFKEALLKTGWASDVRIGLAGDVIASVETGVQPAVGDERHDIGLPGMPNLHSHAFQRAMAGLAEVRGPNHDTFWTWREIMYRLTLAITPEDLQVVAGLLYAEMLEAGFTRVGEFHYLHHDRSGASYCDPVEMAGRIVAAAGETGIGLTLLPVFYAHGGFGGKPPNDSQRRFLCNPEGFARLVEDSRQRAAICPGSVVGIAPHSLRAITPDELAEILPLAPDGPIHIHVAEQVRELEDCLSWSGCRPVEWLLDHAAPDRRWCFIHATHMTAEETKRVAKAGVVAGLCPVTEANLGDGICNGSSFFALGGRFGIGSDSNVLVSVADELRQLEYSQRLLARQRNQMALWPGASSGRTIYDAAVQGGAVALGAAPPVLAPGAPADIVSLDGENTALLEKHGDYILDGWIFAASSSPVDCVWVGGRKKVEGGRHFARQRLIDRYRKSIARLLADL